MILASSIIFNLLLTTHVLILYNTESELTWSKRAALEAEAVAAVSCSGHGTAYLDGIGVLDGIQEPLCECHTCYTGRECSILVPDCPADADSGDPLFLEPFWIQHASSSAVVVSGWHRMSYRYNDGHSSTISKELEKLIRELHEMVGNAVTHDRFIIFGAGSTQVLAAAVHALSPINSSFPARVVASVPYYGLYEEQAKVFDSAEFKFQGDAAQWKNATDSTDREIIEIVTSPNNPDGKLNKAVLDGPCIKSIHDRAYYWPYFTPIPAAANDDLAVFTMSKLTGHAGSRFGWALVKDDAVYKRMARFISVNSIGVSHDTQLRALKLLKVVVDGGGPKEIFAFGYQKMKSRWEELNRILSVSKRFSLQKIEPEYCTYFKKVREFTSAYAWVKCEMAEDENCYDILKAANIIGRRGRMFGARDRFVRLSLIKAQDDFNLLINRLEKLVSNEDGAKSV